jgi:predicted TPR repeat methyltransferase
MQHTPNTASLSWELRGIQARDTGRHEEALNCFEQAVAEGGNARSWLGLALSQIDLKQHDGAVASLRCAAKLAPHSGVVAHTLAALTGANPHRAPDTYVAWLFSRYAIGFDNHLAKLAYRGPEMLSELARQFCQPDGTLDILDLGCGTGLSGAPFRGHARRLEGIDLTPEMLEQAHRRGIYDHLHAGEAHAVMAALPEAAFDLILAADMLIYVGDLDRLFDLAARVLKPGGSFLFTVESGAAGSGFCLNRSGQYSHADDYIRSMAGDRLPVADRIDGMLRIEAGKFMPGQAWRLVRPAKR